MSTIDDLNRRGLAQVAVALACAVVAAACGAGEVADPPRDRIHEFTVERDVVYGVGQVNGGLDSKDLVLDLYTPEDGPTQMPLIVMIHGGAFRGGSKTDTEVVSSAEAYVRQGWLVASIDYRLVRDDPIASARVAPLWELIGGPDASVFNRAVISSIDDTIAALEFLQGRDDVADDKTALWGFSAGASDALWVGFVLDDYGIDRPPIDGVMSLAGGFYNLNVRNPFDDPGGLDPALFVVHGTDDRTVPISFSDEIEEWAIEAGLSLEYHQVDGAGHFVDMIGTEVTPGVSLHQRTVDWLDSEVFNRGS